MKGDKTGKFRSRPSIRDVARHAGVSPGSVSNVMNARRRRDDPIGRAVMEAVAELGYRTNTIASNLRRAQSRIIGLVIPDFQNPFFAELVAELECCAEATNHRIVATSSRESAEIEAREMDELVGWRVAGILVVPSRDSRQANYAHVIHTPMVIVDRVPEQADFDGVAVNNADASAEVTNRLIALGHRRILIAYLDASIDNVAERLLGVRRAVRESAERVEIEYLPCGLTVQSARRSIDDYLSDSPAPTAIFCLYNPATLAAFGAINARGLRIGVDVALVGFDDSAWMAHTHPAVAAVAQPIAEIAQAAWSRLLDRIGGDQSPTGTTRIKCRFDERGTLFEVAGN